MKNYSVKSMPPSDLNQILLNFSAYYKVDPKVMCAIIETESSWNPKLIRYEAEYSYLVDPLKFALGNSINAETETILQKMSWGLCQIMGGNLRSLGFYRIMPDSLDPATNIDFGLKHFKNITVKYPELSDQIAAYNAGSPRKDASGKYINQHYVDVVLSKIR